MIINGKGYICKDCRREMRVDDVTYWGDRGDRITSNCCRAKIVKRNLIELIREWVFGATPY